MNDYFKTLLNGGIAGGVSKCIVSPIEVVKINKQIFNTPYNNIIKQTYTTSGIKGFFRGNHILFTRGFLNYAFQFSFYNNIYQNTNFIKYNNLRILNSSLLSSILSTSMIYPLETLRTNVCISSNKPLKSIILNLYNSNGIKQFYSGYFFSISNNLPYMSINMGIYRKLEKDYSHKYNKNYFGFISGIISSIITMPLDTIRINSHILKTNHTKNLTILDIVKNIYKSDGIQGFYRAGILNTLRTSISTGCLFMIYNFLEH